MPLRRQIGVAVGLYTADNGHLYPTNLTSPGQTTPSAVAFLSPPGQPQKMVTFVEGVENYFPASGVPASLRPATKTGSDPGVWKCRGVEALPKPCREPYNVPSGYGNSRVTYGMNYQLLGKRCDIVRTPAQTMMFRELGFTGQSCAVAVASSPDTEPRDVFWPDPGGSSEALQCGPHAGGSFVLFADGHSVWFSNTLARRGNVVRVSSGRWALCEGGISSKPLVYITP